MISSPYDSEARYSKKRQSEWTGYKVQLTETCDDDTPNLITEVLTTPATTPDSNRLATIQANLAERKLTPREHLVDASYLTADHLVRRRRDYTTDLVGPVGAERSWQAQAGEGFSVAYFVIDWEAQTASCANGKSSLRWLERLDRVQPEVQIKFAPADCRPCPLRSQCSHSAQGARWLSVPAQAQVEALQAAR